MQSNFYPDLAATIEALRSEKISIENSRIEFIRKIARFIEDKIHKSETTNLLFVCTHNSRRSHLGQVWASVAAHYFGISRYIRTFSGGTEITAFNPRAVAALRRTGFKIEDQVGENPNYKVSFSEDQERLECYSKKFDDVSIPVDNLVAIMTCSEADQDCPYIPGVDLRIPLHYEDPKLADGTPEEAARYDERCMQIAGEMFYLMRLVKA
ncbi:MAG: protein-tyrosine-phosphatase [Saprospiraceae bacterium]|nr:protein-tyrosine-phosphatase [Saprospiraceae bacterium]